MSKRKGNIFDKILKENIDKVWLPVIAERYNLKIIKSEVLESKLQVTREREVDFLRKVTTPDNLEFILHLEFQSTNDHNMVYRMLEYHGMLVKKYKLPVYHIVIYLGDTKATMSTELPSNFIFTGFNLLNFKEIDYQKLLSSQIPEVIILAILANHEKIDKELVIRSILVKLKKVCEHRSNLQKFINQLHVLSKLRNLEDNVTKTSEQMPIDISITDYKVYHQGLAEGQKNMEAAIKKAEKLLRQKIEEAIKAEKEKEQEQAILKMLKSGKHTNEEIADIQSVSLEFVQQIQTKKSL